ncbi:MAG: hypothetical protein FJ293_02520 [Planctomycetes bacterium]|nr:hypothetical protein [Planctomycetota bacterium]
MSRKAAALLALIAFAGAWLTGVWCDVAPRARLGSALLAALAGALGGAGIGFALERIVLARLAEEWETLSAAVADPSTGAATTPAAAATPTPTPNGAAAAAPAPTAGTVAAPPSRAAARQARPVAAEARR